MIRSPGCLDLGRVRLQVIIKLIAGLALGAARAPDLPVDLDQADLFRRLVQGAAANLSGSTNERQFVILLEEDHHAVGQLDAARFLGMKRVQRRRLNFSPIRRLAVRGRRGSEKAKRNREGNGNSLARDHYFVSFPAADAWASWVDSIMPTVRLDSTKVAFATLRMSALLTLAMSSTWRKSSRQSP